MGLECGCRLDMIDGYFVEKRGIGTSGKGENDT